MGCEEVGKQGGGGGGVAERVVGSFESDAVALTDVGEAVRQLAIGVEAPRHAQCAQAGVEAAPEGVVARATPDGASEELAVERGVVGGEDRSAHPGAEFVEGVVQTWCAAAGFCG